MKTGRGKYIFLSLVFLCMFSFSSATSFTVTSQVDWNKGNFSTTSADRNDNSGILGLGYLNGTMSGQPYSSGLNGENLVGYWRMDRNIVGEGGTVKDYSGYGNDGSTNDSVVTNVNGILGTKGFEFDGSNSHVEVPYGKGSTGNMTLNAFVKWYGETGDNHYIMNPYGGRYNLRLQLNSDGTPRAVRYSGSSVEGDAVAPFTLETDKWYMITGVYNANSDQVKLYVNATQRASESNGVDIVTDHDYRIGEQPGGGGTFNGTIDEVRIYNRSLSSSEIENLYFKGKDEVYDGNYSSHRFNFSSSQAWNKLEINASVTSGTNLSAKFKAMDSNGDVLESQLIEISDGLSNYSLSVQSSEHAEIVFNGTSNNISKSWKIQEYKVYHGSKNLGMYAQTFEKESDIPRSFFANNTGVKIRTEGNFPSTPDLTIIDSQENNIVDGATMTNVSGIYEYNFTVNQSSGWYDVKINGNLWENVFYQGEKWQGNFTDSDGNKYTFRRKVNVSEPRITDRWFEPVDVNINFGFSPDNDSIRVVAWNGSRMLEIPSQIYNVTKSGETVSNANVVFLSTLNESETRTYYVVSAKSEYSEGYNGLNNTDTVLDTKVENSRFKAYFNQSMGNSMRTVKDKLGTGESLSGSEPMDFYPELQVGLTSFKARIDSTATVNVTEGPLYTEISASGNMNDDDSKPYSVECGIYASNPYMLCEKNLTSKASETWSSFFFNGLVFESGKFANMAYRNSEGDVVTESLSSGNGEDYSSLESDLEWISFFENSTGDGVAELFLDEDFGPTDNPSFQVFDDSSNDYFRQRLISSGTSVSEGDYYYSKTARMIYNGLRESDFVNKTYNQLENPVEVTKGEEVTDDKENPEYFNAGNISTNDTENVTINSLWEDDTFLDNAEINITGNGLNGSDTQLYYNGSYEIRDSGEFINESWVNVTLEKSTVNAGEITANITVFDVAGKSNSSVVKFNVSDATPPKYQSVVNTPNSTAELDPNQKINVTANITEYSNISESYLYFRNGSTSNFSRKPMLRNGEEDFVYTYESNFTPEYEGNYTYYISSNDTLDQRRNSSKNNLTIAWDYTWNLDSNLDGESETFDQNISTGNFTIENTGDFNQSFQLSTGIFNSRTYVNGSRLPSTYEIRNGSTAFFTVNATTRDSTSTEGVDTFNLTIENLSATPNQNYSAFDVTTSTGGPFLFTEISEYNSTVTQGDSGLKLKAETTNKGNETANTVNITFNLPNGWTVSEGERLTSGDSLVLEIGTSKTFTTKFDIPNDASTGQKTLEAVARSQEDNRSTSVEVTVEAKDSGNNQQPSESGSGGGGGGGGSVSSDGSGLTNEQQQKLFQTEEKFEIVRGEDQKFTLTVENPFEEGNLEDVSVNVSGFLSQYLSVEPNKLDNIPVNRSKNFTISIEAPRYFNRGEYDLEFNISGLNNRSEIIEAGNNSYLSMDVREFRENRNVDLTVHEISEEKASKSLNESKKAFEELKEKGISYRDLNETIIEAKQALNSGNYQKAWQLSEKVIEQRQQAETAEKTIEEVDKLVKDAEYRGLDSPRTERMVSMAETALERGDYSMAAERASEAETLYAVETKGEINYINYTKRNWKKLSLAFIIVSGLGFGGFLRLRLFRIKRRLGKLDEEEQTLLGLMKQVQRESFEEGKMSMEEYEEAMMQYEKQLSQNVKETVRLESEKAHWMRIRRGTQIFEHERDRIQDLMQETQEKYLEEGSIETRVYKQKMQTFRERLTEIEGKLAEKQAQKQINQKTSLGGKLKNAIPV